MGMRRRSIFENNALKALVSNSDVWGDDSLAALGRMFVPSMISINSSSFDSIGGGIGLLVLLTPAWPTSVHVVASNGCNRVYRDTAQAKQFLHLWCLLWFVLRSPSLHLDQPVSPTSPYDTLL